MLFLQSNLKYLRHEQGLSQQVLADKIHVSRASLAKYEGGINEPALEVIIRLSRYFRITIDALLTLDLQKTGSDIVRQSGLTNSIIVPIQVDASGDNIVEIVPHHAQAGYVGNYSDPGFIEKLDQMALPFQELHGKCRAFPIAGDSMPPHGDGSYIIGRWLEGVADLRENKRYIFVTRDEGIVFKRANMKDCESDHIRLVSDNPKYKPFDVHLREINEIWEFVAAISFGDASANSFNEEVLDKVKALKEEVEKLASQLVF